MNALLISYTVFPDTAAQTKVDRIDAPWSEIVERVRSPRTYPAKTACPLISLSDFGEMRSDKNSLRHTANVLRTYGVEVDYDGEQVSPARAAELLQAANLESVIYTSPSHRPEAPRWRVLAPLSSPEVPAARARLVGRLNRALGGIAGPESFDLSRSYYIGRVKDAPYEAHETHGRCVDEAIDLEPLMPDGVNAAERPRPASLAADAVLRAFSERGLYRGELKPGQHAVICPWESEHTTERTAADAAIYQPHFGGFKAHGFRCLHGHCTGRTIGDVRRFLGLAGNGAAQGDEPAPIVFAKIDVPNVADVVARPVAPRTWFFDQIIPAGAFLIVGRPKIGKSWLLLQLALAAARGQSFLGYQNIGPTGVLFVAAEDDAARIQDRFNIIGNGNPPANLRIMLGDQFRALAQQYGHVQLAEFFSGYLAAHPAIKMMILDTEATCRAIWDGEGNRLRDIKARDYGETREFDQLALMHRAFVGLVNHAGKRKGGGYLDLHELVNRTNVALAGASGSIVLADPPDRQVGDDEDKRRVLGIRGRDLKDDVMLAVEQQADASFKCLGEWTAVAATYAEQEALDAAFDINADTPGQWISSKVLADAIGKHPGSVKRCITRMLKAGRGTWKGYRVETRASKGLRLVPIGEALN